MKGEDPKLRDRLRKVEALRIAEQAKRAEERRTMVLDVLRAVETLGTMNETPTAFLEAAPTHLVWGAREKHLCPAALKWLTALDAAWNKF